MNVSVARSHAHIQRLTERRQLFDGPPVRSSYRPVRQAMTPRRQAMVVHAEFALGFFSAIVAILFGIPMLSPKFEGSSGVGLSPSTFINYALMLALPGKVPNRWLRAPNRRFFLCSNMQIPAHHHAGMLLTTSSSRLMAWQRHSCGHVCFGFCTGPE